MSKVKVGGFAMTRPPYYVPELDGSLEEYLRERDGFSATPLFFGSDSYRLLWDEGWLIPEISVVRLMWNIGRDDEHFFVINRDTIQGTGGTSRHAGRPGVFRIEEIFDKPQILDIRLCFEVSGLASANRRVVRAE